MLILQPKLAFVFFEGIFEIVAWIAIRNQLTGFHTNLTSTLKLSLNNDWQQKNFLVGIIKKERKCLKQIWGVVVVWTCHFTLLAEIYQQRKGQELYVF